MSEFGLNAQLLSFRDNGRLEKVRRDINEQCVAENGMGSNFANPDILRDKIVKEALEKMH